MSCTPCENENQTYDTKIVQGATFRLAFKVVGVNLTGASLDMAVAAGYPATVVHNPTTVNGGITVTITTPITDQTVVCVIDEVDTLTEHSPGTYDVFADLSTGDRIKLLSGKMGYEKSIVRV